MADTDLREIISRAVLDDLEDRRDIKQPLLYLKYEDEEIYEEIKQAICIAVVKRLGDAGYVIAKLEGTVS